MNIRGIDHVIVFWAEDDNGKTLKEAQFPDFHSFNQWLWEHKDDPELEDANGAYSLAEVSNGTTGGISFFNNMFAIEPLYTDDAKDCIEYYVDYLDGIRTSTPEDSGYRPLALHPESDNFEEKKGWRQDYSYVCPHCLYPIDDCKCTYYPFYALQIDTAILPAIRELNQKGYETRSCCGGHIREDKNGELSGHGGVHVQFGKRYDFAVDFPEGANYWKVKEHLQFTEPTNKSQKEFEAYLDCAREALAAWVHALPNLNPVNTRD